jgi:chorismate dehydratase
VITAKQDVLRCGRISYANDLPIYAAFDAGVVECPATLYADVPAALNRMLLSGGLDVSPISSFFFAQHAGEFCALPRLGIGSRREVRSIYCISKTPPRRLKGVPIAVTTESSTGRNLFATICAEAYGFAPQFEDSAEPYAAYRDRGMPCLLIGDKAIDAFLSADKADAHDVGALWYEATGHHMLYALWAVRNDVAASRADDVRSLMDALLEAQTWGRHHPDRVIAAAEAAIMRPPGFYHDYYQAIEIGADPQGWYGLEMFFKLAAKHKLLPAVPKIAHFEKLPEHV